MAEHRGGLLVGTSGLLLGWLGIWMFLITQFGTVSPNEIGPDLFGNSKGTSMFYKGKKSRFA